MVETALKTTAAERRGVEAGAARAEARPRLTPRTAWALACLAVDHGARIPEVADRHTPIVPQPVP